MEFGYIRFSGLPGESEKKLATFNDTPISQLFVELNSYAKEPLAERTKLLDTLKPGDVLHIQSLDEFFMTLEEMDSLLEQVLAKDVTLHCHTEEYIFSAHDKGDFTALFRKIVRQVADAMKKIKGEELCTATEYNGKKDTHT